MARLIDADALRKVLCEDYEAREHYIGEKMLEAIDNAPTVDLTKNQAYDKGFITAMKLYSRPKGEWVLNKDENPECPFCHHSFTCWGNFCSNCGADMR